MKKIDETWLLKKAAFVLVILLLPLIDSLSLDKSQNYTRASSAFSPKFSYIYKRIHQTDKSIDFLFMGSSCLWVSVDAQLLENQLELLTKSNVSVENFGHNFLGIDVDYLLLEDVLKNNKVKNLFLEMPIAEQVEPHRVTRFLWQSPADLFASSFDVYSKIYAEKLLESPSNFYFALKNEQMVSSEQFDKSQGTLLKEQGYEAREDQTVTVAKFERLASSGPKLSSNDLTFKFNDERANITGKFSEYQMFFLAKIIALAEKHNIKLFFLVSPRLAPNSDLSKLQIMVSGNSEFDQKLQYFGYPVSKLLDGINAKDMRKFFYNYNHTNINGAEVFTKTLAKPLSEIYEKSQAI